MVADVEMGKTRYTRRIPFLKKAKIEFKLGKTR